MGREDGCAGICPNLLFQLVATGGIGPPTRGLSGVLAGNLSGPEKTWWRLRFRSIGVRSNRTISMLSTSAARDLESRPAGLEGGGDSGSELHANLNSTATVSDNHADRRCIGAGVGAGRYFVGTSADDVLEGTPEADTLDGKGGADTMMGLGGDDEYIVENADDAVIEGAGEGNDTIRSHVTFKLPIFVENLILTGIAPTRGTGNDLNNRLTGNGANNTLNGGAGSDTMIGKAGDDLYVVDDVGDVVSESTDQGTDSVRSFVTLTLRPNIEKLFLRGSAAINGSGNDLNNLIVGNSANNVLVGKAGNDRLKGTDGNDRLVGGDGNDALAGGLGQDTFEFDAPLNESTNIERISDFNPPDDVMELEGAVFPTLTTAGTLQASAFRAATVAGAPGDRILYVPDTGALRYDADGTGPIAPVRFGTLAAGLAVTNADFVVHNPVAPPAVDYTTQIQPIFTGRCVSCHSGGGAPQGLRARCPEQLRQPGECEQQRSAESQAGQAIGSR